MTTDATTRASQIFEKIGARFDDATARAAAIETLALALAEPQIENGLVWKAEPNRIAAYSGRVAIGAIFPKGDQKFCRWRIWVSMNMNPIDGVATTRAEAQNEITLRFWKFVREAGLCLAFPAEARNTRLANKIGEAYQAVGQIMHDQGLEHCPKVIALLDLLTETEAGQ